MHLRHYGVLRAELTLSDKVPYAFAAAGSRRATAAR